jgi:hypothetical protein
MALLKWIERKVVCVESNVLLFDPDTESLFFVLCYRAVVVLVVLIVAKCPKAINVIP